MNPNHDHYPEGEALHRSLSTRYRNASIWQALFFSALVIAMLSLAALLYNIVDGAFGYVAFEYKNDPAEFTTKPLDDLNKQELLDILKANLSAGAYTKLNNEKPMEKRSKSDLYTLVLERLIQIDTKQIWSMTDSIFHRAEIKAEVAEKYPEAILEFRSWLTASVPYHSHVLKSRVCGCAHSHPWLAVDGGDCHSICPAHWHRRSHLSSRILQSKFY